MYIRPAEQNDLPFLEIALYEAAYWRQDMPRPDIEQGLQRNDLIYLLKDWGREGDLAFIARMKDTTLWGQCGSGYGAVRSTLMGLFRMIFLSWA